MPRVIAVHSVGNMDTWLAGGAEREAVFKNFSSSYRIFRQPDSKRIAMVWENADMARLRSTLSSPETMRLRAKHTVSEDVEMFVEIEGAR
ncbi:MAG TPA: hypothetical protein PKE29_00350 [Phycisphaerales bacterium]|nr:hypothetical protein [Phycisphaerales bacterium]